MFNDVFMGDIREPFNTRRFAMERSPVEGFAYSPAKPHRAWSNRNHWMIKSKSQNFIILDELEPDVRRFCQKAIDFMRAFRLPFEDRYLYLSVEDHRDGSSSHGGWQFEGLQGPDTHSPAPGCFQFLWSSQSSMEYADQTFRTKGLNRHQANLTDSLSRQVSSERIYGTKPGLTYLLTPYHLHRPSQAVSDGPRKTIRLVASHLPVTSSAMTINPLMEYDFTVHTTSDSATDHSDYLMAG